MPVLFVNGTNDFFFWLDSWTKTTQLPQNTYMALQVKMGHSHRRADVPVVYAFADMVTKGRAALPRLVAEGVKDNVAFAEFDCPDGIIAAKYAYSSDGEPSTKRNWKKVDLKVTGKGRIKLQYTVPDNAVVGYFKVFIKNEYASETGFCDKYGSYPVFSSSRPIMYKK